MLKRSLWILAAATFAATLQLAAGAPAVAAPDPGSAAVLDDARVRIRAADVAGAISELAPYVAAHPTERAAAVLLGDLYLRNDDVKAAERTYLALSTLAPDDKELHDRLGNAYAADDMLPQAIAEYERSLPDLVAYASLVRLHRHIGDLDSFVALMREKAQANEADATAQFGYGVVLRDTHHPSEAISYLQRVVRMQPSSCPALTELGNTYLDLEQRAIAAGEFRLCLALRPNDYGALVDLSLTYDAVTEAADARRLLDKAYALQPNRPEALIDYGYLADVAGRMQEAIAYYDRALDSDVLARDAYVNLGYDYQSQHQFALAEAALIKGLTVSPKDGRIEYLLGQAYAEQGKAALALAQFSDASQSDDPEIRRAARTRLAMLR